MEYDKIKQLMEDMGNSKLTDIDIEFPDGTKISMKKSTTIKKEIITDDSNIETKEISSKNIIQNNENTGNIVKSPMVGTFYIKPAPTENPYVEIGKQVKKGDTLCILEAMKLMNEIESEFTGTITEIYVKDGETVEYGTPLFKIEGED